MFEFATKIPPDTKHTGGTTDGTPHFNTDLWKYASTLVCL